MQADFILTPEEKKTITNLIKDYEFDVKEVIDKIYPHLNNNNKQITKAQIIFAISNIVDKYLSKEK